MRPDSRCSGVPRTGINTIFGCIMKIQMLRFFGPPYASLTPFFFIRNLSNLFWCNDAKLSLEIFGSSLVQTFKCYLFQETFNSEDDLENHYNARHPNQCQDCRAFKPNQCSFFAPTLFNIENTLNSQSIWPGGSSYLSTPQSGALRISAYRDFRPIPIPSNPIPSHPNPTCSFWAFKPFYSDQKQCK